LYHSNHKIPINYGIGFVHFSNGGVRTPNIGLNGLEGLLAYKLAHTSKIKVSNYSPKKTKVQLAAQVGAKSAGATSGSLYPVYSVSAAYVRHIHNINTYVVVEGLHDASIASRNTIDERNTVAPWLASSQYSVGVGASVAQLKWQVGCDLGWYVWYAAVPKKKMINKLYIGRFINKNVVIRLGVHAHLGVADHTFMGLLFAF
jgi:hypothetical protein